MDVVRLGSPFRTIYTYTATKPELKPSRISFETKVELIALNNLLKNDHCCMTNKK